MRLTFNSAQTDLVRSVIKKYADTTSRHKDHVAGDGKGTLKSLGLGGFAVISAGAAFFALTVPLAVLAAGLGTASLVQGRKAARDHEINQNYEWVNRRKQHVRGPIHIAIAIDAIEMRLATLHLFHGADEDMKPEWLMGHDVFDVNDWLNTELDILIGEVEVIDGSGKYKKPINHLSRIGRPSIESDATARPIL